MMDMEPVAASPVAASPAACSIQNGPFICGGCGATMDSICILYAHMSDTHSDGSFHYDNMIKTGFPKYDSCCVNTQTESKYKSYMKKYRHSYRDRPPKVFDGQAVETEVVGTRIYLKHVEDLQTIQPNEQVTRKKQLPKKNYAQKSQVQMKKQKLLKQSHAVPSKVSNTLRRSTRITRSSLQNCVVLLNSIDIVKTEKDIPRASQACSVSSSVINDQPHPSYKQEAASEHLVSGVIVNGETCKVKTETAVDDQEDPYSDMDAIDDDIWDDIQPFLDDKPLANEAASQHNTVPTVPFKCDDDGEFTHVSTDTVGSNNESATRVKPLEREYNKKLVDRPEGEHRPRGRPRKYEKRGRRQRGPRGRPRTVKFICHICGKEIKRDSDKIEGHMNDHIGLKPYICDICAMPFADQIKLKRHVMRHEVHVRTSKFQCEECGRHFPCKQEYMAHVNRHSGLKPYKCEQCGCTFATSKYRRQHTYRTHTTFSRNCKICGKIYTKLTSLDNHMAVAHVEPAFQCRFCDRRFKIRKTWRNHECTHSGTKQYFCCVCNHGFIQWTPYLAHMMKQHGFSKERVVELKEIQKQSEALQKAAGVGSTAAPAAVPSVPSNQGGMDNTVCVTSIAAPNVPYTPHLI